VGKKSRFALYLAAGALIGVGIGRIIQPGVIVWEHVQDIEVGANMELEIASTTGWHPDERWRIYTLDMDVDPHSSNRPVISLGHDGDLELALFRGLQHNEKFDVVERFSDNGSRLVYRIPARLLGDKPVRLWLWSGDTGYSFRVNGVALRERASWRLTEDNPYFFYTVQQRR